MNTHHRGWRYLAILGLMSGAYQVAAQVNSPGDPFSGLATFTQTRTANASEGLPPAQTVEADVFWRSSALEGVQPDGIDLRGINARYVKTLESTKTQFAATVPVYFANSFTPAVNDYWMSGLDVNLEQPIGEIVAAGVHGSWLRTGNESRPLSPGSTMDTFIGGAYVAARYQVHERVKLGLAVSYDRNYYEGGDSGTVGIGTSATLKATDKLDVIPRAMYFNNHDLSGFSDKDSFELGVVARYRFSEVWSLGLGFQSTVGSDYLKYSHMVFLATSFRF